MDCWDTQDSMTCHLEHCVTGSNPLHWELCTAKMRGKILKKYGGVPGVHICGMIFWNVTMLWHLFMSLLWGPNPVNSLLIMLSRWRTQAYSVTCLAIKKTKKSGVKHYSSDMDCFSNSSTYWSVSLLLYWSNVPVLAIFQLLKNNTSYVLYLFIVSFV